MSVLAEEFAEYPEVSIHPIMHRTEMAEGSASIYSEELFVSIESESEEENESLMDFQLSYLDGDISYFIDGRYLIDVEMVDAELVTM